MSFLYSQLFTSLPIPTHSFNGQTIIVTGANSGLGLEAARHIARLGVSTLILAVRNISSGEAARTSIISSTGISASAIQVWPLDLSSYASVQSFAVRARTLPRLDGLLSSAGVAMMEYQRLEKDDACVTINVVSTFLLAFLLMPALRASASKHGTRPIVTIVSSAVHGYTTFPDRHIAGPEKGALFATMADPEKAVMNERYPVSKLLQVFVVRAFVERYPAKTFPVTVDIIDPGFCESGLSRNAKGMMGWQLWTMKKVLARTTEAGSRTLVDALGRGKEAHGVYHSSCMPSEPSELVRSGEGRLLQNRIWEELVDKLEAISPGIMNNV